MRLPPVLLGVWALMAAAPAAADCAEGTAWIESTLYMGRGLGDGRMVPDSEVDAFVADTAVPAFPDGFTIVNASGHWRDGPTGRPINESTVMFVVAHPPGPEADAALRRIAEAYIARFRQSAVLRSDAPVCVTFYEKK